MRQPEFISPSALKLFEHDKRAYYSKYLAENRPPREPQTNAMSVGSAFDAFVKSYLYEKVHGNFGPNNEYERRTLFEAQVEEHVRDFAWDAGMHVFSKYSRSGALGDLMLELDKSIQAPRFEFDVRGIVECEINNVPMLGKPDIFFVSNEGARVIFDWKVNGYCSKHPYSPVRGYIKVRDTWDVRLRKSSRRNGLHHPEASIGTYKGFRYNASGYMEEFNDAWADQLIIYAWLLGETPGSEDLLVGIDQIVAIDQLEENGPFLRVANHRCKVSHDWQMKLLSRLDYMWTCITSGHFFDHVSKEESDKLCQELEDYGKMMSNTDDPFVSFLRSL